MYLTNTRPNICFAMNTSSQYMVELRIVNLIATKHVMRYLKGTIHYGRRYASNREISLEGFIDSDWVGSVADQKSTSGCCFSMGSTMISWFNRKQTSVARSSVASEATYRIFDLELEVTCIWCDNQSCVKLTENPVFHDKSKHIEIR
jgi:hypothetical protein